MALEETHLIGYPHFYLIVLNVLYVGVLPQILFYKQIKSPTDAAILKTGRKYGK